MGQHRKVTEKNDADITTGDFSSSFHRRNLGKDAPDPSARLGSNVGPDGGIRRLLRFHGNKKE